MSDTHKLRILVGDSSPIFALGLVQALSEDERIEVFDHAYDGQAVMDKVEEIEPDIVVIDSELPNHGGVRVTEMLRELYPEVKVIILAPPQNAEAFLDSATNAGAKGLLLRTISPTELINSVVETANGGVAISRRLIPLVLGKLAAREEKPVVQTLFSAREREVVELVAKGRSNHEIAKALFLTENTVRGYLSRITHKLKVNNRVGVARYALRNELRNHQEESRW